MATPLRVDWLSREYAVGKENKGGQIVMSSPSGGFTDDNHVPWCIAPATDPSKQAAVAKFLADNTVNGQPPPLCPAALLGHLADADGNRHTQECVRVARRNQCGGFAVFYYLDQVSKGLASTARFDECTLAPPSP